MQQGCNIKRFSEINRNVTQEHFVTLNNQQVVMKTPAASVGSPSDIRAIANYRIHERNWINGKCILWKHSSIQIQLTFICYSGEDCIRWLKNLCKLKCKIKGNDLLNRVDSVVRKFIYYCILNFISTEISTYAKIRSCSEQQLSAPPFCTPPNPINC
jgi:hypothetical protein